MRFAGIDIGSRTIELVVLREGEIIETKQADSGFDPMGQAGEMLEGVKYDHIMATGYGRHLFERSFDAPTVTEIKAYAMGGVPKTVMNLVAFPASKMDMSILRRSYRVDWTKRVGETTNMLDIVTAMQLADKVINI